MVGHMRHLWARLRSEAGRFVTEHLVAPADGSGCGLTCRKTMVERRHRYIALHRNGVGRDVNQKGIREVIQEVQAVLGSHSSKMMLKNRRVNQETLVLTARRWRGR